MQSNQIRLTGKYNVKIITVTVLCLLAIGFSGCSYSSSEKGVATDSTTDNSQVTKTKSDNVKTNKPTNESLVKEHRPVNESLAEESKPIIESKVDGDNNASEQPWLFGEKDLYINKKPFWGLRYNQLLKAFGTPKIINSYKVNPPATEDDFYNYFKVVVYDGFECELYLGEEDREQVDTDKVFRFDITNNNVELDCGLKVGMTTDEILNRFGDRGIYNINDTNEQLNLSDIKHVLKSYKPKGYYTEYSQAMIIYADQQKFEEPLAKALVLLLNEDKLKRIVFGYPTAD
jgi:hypothetical protein